MKTLQHNHTDIISRINNLTAQSKPRRGKLSLSQMLTHCIAILQVTAAHQFSPESFADQILKAISKSASPQHNAIHEEKERLISSVKQNADNTDAGIYQNLDEHLQRFSV
ncbi:hypothetical protein [Mucilaginibacter terrae]|uniref:Hemerythrin n=1 Tax=Mucilaginibacter terrae TaxID=1955052 RepID=A0ABU3GTJ9_9SPHI|nr:hypothetical protein [Mucilaginibacter terrae]MDT3403111.1 hemerythrin [Mucilaginibacter terrae]